MSEFNSLVGISPLSVLVPSSRNGERDGGEAKASIPLGAVRARTHPLRFLNKKGTYRNLWSIVSTLIYTMLVVYHIKPIPYSSIRISFSCISKTNHVRRNEGGKEVAKRKKKHTTAGIRWSSPTQLLIGRFSAYLWESGRDPEFSESYGRMCLILQRIRYI